MDVSGKIAQANGRLKAARVRVRIEQMGDRLYLRATLPPKPTSTKTQPYQQRIATGLGAHPRGVSLAEAEARKIAALVETSTFDWGAYLSQSGDRQLVSHWITRFEAEIRDSNRGGVNPATWKTDYQGVLALLPGDKPLTLDMLVQVVEATRPNTKQRRRTAQTLAKLARFAGIDDQPLKALRGKYSAKEVDPRALPTDDEIASFREQIHDPGWRWVYGMLATYGLRPHEVWHLDLTDYPTIHVKEGTKTGDRFVFPLHPEWPNLWSLDSVSLPPLARIDLPNDRMGAKISTFFLRMGFPSSAGATLKAYDLRHCYARRSLEFGLSPDMAAKLMGHSVAVHCQTYRRWIDLGTYQRIYEQAIAKTGAHRIHPVSENGASSRIQ